MRHVFVLLLIGIAAQPGWSQHHRMLCDHGNNGFSANSPTGVSVVVGPSHIGGFGTRACTAELVWGKQKLTIADQFSQVDLDLFAADIGLPVPVAAFQLKQSSEGCCTRYEIYSLRGTPRLLRTLQGGFFNAADTDLDGRVEIWAEDGGAVDGLDDLPASAFDFLPTYVLRFEGDLLVNATEEFIPHFEEIIGGLRKMLSTEQLADFKNSDGKLTFSIGEVEHLHNLRKTKIAVLEIVWTYLYSGREQEAWRALREMWPTTDVARIQAAIAGRHQRGILRQLDGIATQPGRRKHAIVFRQTEVIAARAIDPSFPGLGAATPKELTLDLVIDSAGKVHIAKPDSDVDPYVFAYIQAWKFVPAMQGGHAVASRLHLVVSLKQ